MLNLCFKSLLFFFNTQDYPNQLWFHTQAGLINPAHFSTPSSSLRWMAEKQEDLVEDEKEMGEQEKEPVRGQCHWQALPG